MNITAADDVLDINFHKRFARQATTKKVTTTSKKGANVKATTKKVTKGTTKKGNLVAVIKIFIKSGQFD